MDVSVVDLVGYFIQILLLLALLICLSIRSWPLLIAIVIIGIFMLGIACLQLSNNNKSSDVQVERFHEQFIEEDEEPDPHSLTSLHKLSEEYSLRDHESFSMSKRNLNPYNNLTNNLTRVSLMQSSSSSSPMPSPTPQNPMPISPYLAQSYQTTPEMLEAQVRQRRWQAQSAMPTYGIPMASQQYLVSMQTQDVYRPDPNLIPVNHTSGYPPLHANQQRRIQQTSPWASRSYLTK